MNTHSDRCYATAQHYFLQTEKLIDVYEKKATHTNYASMVLTIIFSDLYFKSHKEFANGNHTI